MLIFSKVPDFTGIRASVMFVNGQGNTDDPHLIEWFKNHGYVVGDGTPTEAEDTLGIGIDSSEAYDVVDAKLKKLKDDKSIEFPHFPSMTSDEIRAWAKKNGLGLKIKNYHDKDKLIAILTE